MPRCLRKRAYFAPLAELLFVFGLCFVMQYFLTRSDVFIDDSVIETENILTREHMNITWCGNLEGFL